MSEAIATPGTGRTAWARSLAAPVSAFVNAEAGSALVLLAGALAALAWANVDASSYASFWATELSVRLGDWSLSLDLRSWVNEGLMTFFFFVVGLEARREFDLGELRDRRRISLPVLAAIGGMVLPVLIYLAINAGHGTAGGWGTAMSTDTAFALGVLAVVTRTVPARLRVFLLSLAVVDDVIALLVIATVYSTRVDARALVLAITIFAVGAVLKRRFHVRYGIVYLALGATTWTALHRSGIDPVIVGLALGLLTPAYPAPREELEEATRLYRSFREQPTPELARSARLGLAFAISPNERLQGVFHPWTSYVIVPLFVLANAGLHVDSAFVRQAVHSPVTIGIVVGYVVGKPLGIVGASWLGVRAERGRVRPPVGWPWMAAGGTVAGIGFTVSLLIAGRAFSGARLEEAKAGVLAGAVLAAGLGWVAFHSIRFLPRSLRIRQLAGTAEELVDLVEPVDERRDHVRGPAKAPVTLVEYGDFECPFCGQAESAVREVLAEFGDDVRYVWRQLPLADVHPRAQLAAEASEAAAAQDAFWPMYDVLLRNQDALRPDDLVRYAEGLGLDVDRFAEELRRHVYARRVSEDVESADHSAVSGTPTFFVNGLRHHGAYDAAGLGQAVIAARKRALVTQAAATLER